MSKTTRPVFRIVFFFTIVLAVAVYGQTQSNDQSTSTTKPEDAPKAAHQDEKKTGPGKEMGHGGEDLGKGVAKGTGDLAKGTGGAVGNLARGNFGGSGASLGKGVGGFGKNVVEGTGKGVGKIGKGLGGEFKKIGGKSKGHEEGSEPQN